MAAEASVKARVNILEKETDRIKDRLHDSAGAEAVLNVKMSAIKKNLEDLSQEQKEIKHSLNDINNTLSSFATMRKMLMASLFWMPVGAFSIVALDHIPYLKNLLT